MEKLSFFIKMENTGIIKILILYKEQTILINNLSGKKARDLSLVT